MQPVTEGIVYVSNRCVSDTLEILRSSGAIGNEGIVLWLGKRGPERNTVLKTYVPDHEAERDYFRIPPQAVAQLLSHLRDTGLSVIAQVHSHPKEAFHSITDDTWAIVRHVGALSLVVPYFARNTTADAFLADIAVFELSPKNEWTEVAPSNFPSRIQVE